MAVEEIVSGFLQGNSILVFIALIILFVVAYKVLKLIIQTFIVVVLSGLFYVALNYIGLGVPLSIGNLILFMFLGGLLFVVYSMIALVASGAIKIFGGLSKIIKKPLEKRKKKKEEKRIKEKEKKKHEEEKKEDDESSQKEVVLKEMMEDMKNE